MATIGTLVLSLQAKTDDLARGLNKARADVQGFTASIRRTAGQMSAALTAIPAALAGIAAAGGLAQAVRIMADFEQKMSDVRAVTQATTTQMRALTTEARRLGAETQFSASDAAAGMAMLGQAGFSTDQIIAAMGDTLNLAAAGGLELAQAAEIVSNILSTFNVNATETKRVTDVLAAAAAISNTNVQQLGEAFSFAGPIAAGFGHSIEATASALATLSNRGIQASRAGEGLRRVLGVLADPTKEVRDALDALQQIFPTLELSLEKLNPQTNSTAEIFARLSPVLQDTRVAFKLFGVEGAGVAQILAQNVTQLQQYEARVQSSGQAAAQAAIRVDNLKGDFGELTSAIEEVVLQLGDTGLLGALRNAVQSITGMIRESYSLRVALVAIGKALDIIIRGIATFALSLEHSLSQAARTAVYFGGQIQTALVNILPVASRVFGTLEENMARQNQRLKESEQAWNNYQKNLGNALGMNEKFNEAVREGQDAMSEDPWVAQHGLPKTPITPPVIDLKGAKPKLDALFGGPGADGGLKGKLDTVEDITKTVKDLENNLAALDRQASMVPGFDLAKERVDLLDKGLRKVTEAMTQQPELAAKLPPEIRAAVAAMGPQLKGFQEMEASQARAKDAARELANEQERQAKQAVDFVRGLEAEAQQVTKLLELQRDSVTEADLKTAAIEREAQLLQQNIHLTDEQRTQAEANLQLVTRDANLKAKLLEFEAQQLQRNIKLTAEQRAEAEAHLQAVVEAESAMQALEKARTDARARAESVRDFAREVDLQRQLVSTERMSAEQREISTRVLTMEAELIANKITLTDAYRASIQALATTEAQLTTASLKAAGFRERQEQISDLKAVLQAQNLSARERAVEIALIQEKRRLNREMSSEEVVAMRQQMTLQEQLNHEIARPRPLRDFLESGGQENFFTKFEETIVQGLEGVEEAFSHFLTTGSFQSPEQIQGQRDINALMRERRSLTQEIHNLQSLPIQYGPEQLRNQERVDALDREVALLDERKKALEENIKSQGMLNKLAKTFLDQMLQASIRSLFTAPAANQGNQWSQQLQGMAGQGGGGWGALLSQGMNLLSGIFGGGTGTAAGAAGAIQGFRDAGFTQGIVAHSGGVVGRDRFSLAQVPSDTFTRAPRFASGGLVTGSGDTVPALLQTGERVLSRNETTRMARLETLARQVRSSDQAQTGPTTVHFHFPGVQTRQDADAIRRSASQMQNSLMQAVERSRSRSNVPSPAR